MLLTSRAQHRPTCCRSQPPVGIGPTKTQTSQLQPSGTGDLGVQQDKAAELDFVLDSLGIRYKMAPCSVSVQRSLASKQITWLFQLISLLRNGHDELDLVPPVEETSAPLPLPF